MESPEKTESTMGSLRILIADDHEMMLAGVRTVIERQVGWEVCGVATTGRQAVERAFTLKPDIVVMDMSMPELNGLDAAVQIKRKLPQTEIVILSAHETEELIRDAFAAGVKSFVFKSQTQQFLVEAVRSLSQHKPFFISAVSEALFAEMLNHSEGKPRSARTGQGLTGREREIVRLLAEGSSNKEIAGALGISIRTAETHRANILRKLRVDSLAGLVRYAIRKKIIES
jgi:two-component system response regulator NreC